MTAFGNYKGENMSDICIDILNEKARSAPDDMVREAEARYVGFISSIAERIISNDHIRVVLLAGPSGSGKTTSANLLSDELIRRGLESRVLSLDDFYRDSTDPEYPRLSSGERDYEAPEALNLPDLVKTLSDIANGKVFSVPNYDFKLGKRTHTEIFPKISHGCVIIEGLHALNPKVFDSLPRDKMLRIFISVSTNLALADGKRVLSGRKLRFVRRMVRDSLYRGADAERTLLMWENVLHGEDKYLYPFRDNADISFDTFHDFEYGVMRPFVLKLITEELSKKSSYAAAVREAALLAESIRESHVPETSLIREFIPGGIYEDLY